MWCFDVSIVYSLLMMPSLVLSRNFTIAVISLPAGTCSFTWLIASNTLVCPWNTRR